MLVFLLHGAFDREQTFHLISRWSSTEKDKNIVRTAYVHARAALRQETTFSVAQMRGDTLSCFVLKNCGLYHELIVALTDEKKDVEGVLTDFLDWYDEMPIPLIL